MSTEILELGGIDATGVEMVVEASGMGTDRIKDSGRSAENTSKHTGAEPCLGSFSGLGVKLPQILQPSHQVSIRVTPVTLGSITRSTIAQSSSP